MSGPANAAASSRRRGQPPAVHDPDVEQPVREVDTPAGREPHPVVGAVARRTAATTAVRSPAEFGAAADGARCAAPAARRAPRPASRRSAGDQRSPLPHQLRIHAQAEGVEEDAPRGAATRNRAHVHRDGLAVCGRARRRSRSPSTPRSWAKWFRVPPGSTASGRPCRRAISAAALTVPSPPHTPSTRARAAAFSSSSCSRAGFAHHDLGVRQRVRAAPGPGPGLPAPVFATMTSPPPSGSAGASRARPGRRRHAGPGSAPGRVPRTPRPRPARRPRGRRSGSGRRCTRGRAPPRRRAAPPPRPSRRDSSATPVGERRRGRGVSGGERRGDRLPLQPPDQPGPGPAPAGGRRTDRLPRVLIVGGGQGQRGDAARRPPGGPAACRSPPRAAAVANHSSPWLALRLSRGSTRSAPGQCRERHRLEEPQVQGRSRSTQAVPARDRGRSGRRQGCGSCRTAYPGSGVFLPAADGLRRVVLKWVCPAAPACPENACPWDTWKPRTSSTTSPTGRALLGDVSFRVGEGAVVALVGPERRGQDDPAPADLRRARTARRHRHRRAAGSA